MTALDRASLEVAKGLQDAPCSPSFGWDDVNGWTREKSEEIARAVLMSIRGVQGFGVEIDVWSELIVDHILKETDAQ